MATWEKYPLVECLIFVDMSASKAFAEANPTDLTNWLQEPSRPGRFTFPVARIGVIFSDPDTAFEFKIRWG